MIKAFVFSAMIFLCCAVCAAQETINHEQLQKIKQFVAIRYTDAFFKSQSDTMYQNAFPDVSNWNIDTCSNRYEEYVGWLKENDKNETLETLTNVIIERVVTANRDSIFIIPQGTRGRYPGLLSDTKEQVKESVYAYFSNNASVSNNRIRKKDEVKNHSEMNAVLIIVLSVVFSVSLTLVIMYFLWERKIKNKIRHKTSERTEKEPIAFEKQRLPSVNSNRTETNIKELKEELLELKRIVEAIQQNASSVNAANKVAVVEPQKSEPSQRTTSENSKIEYRYAKNYSGELKECDENRAQFRIIVEKAGYSKFEFCGNKDVALSNPDATFDGACITNGVSSKATKIVTSQKGDVELRGNVWKVINKATINFV